MTDSDTILTGDSAMRYARNMALSQFGPDGQRRLLEGAVLIVGAGALGSAAAVALAAAGVGRLRIVDFDTVSISNLPRQTAYSTADLGEPKVTALQRRLNALNPDIEIEACQELLSARNFDRLTENIGLIIEGSDNPATKYLVTRMAREKGLTCIVGGVYQFEGQLMVFGADDRPAYQDIFPEPASEGCAIGTPCSQGAVYSPLPPVIGTMQASEAIKELTGIGSTLRGRLLTLDMLTMTPRVIRLRGV